MRPVAAALFGVAGVGSLIATLVLHKDDAFAMEIPKDTYPVAAVQFMRDHELSGNLLVFFDWGEMCIWELPDCPVSVDGRLDTCYPRDVLKANWDVFNGEVPDKAVLDLDDADLALIRQDLAGAMMLANRQGWALVYQDPLAALFVRDISRYAGLAGSALPVIAREKAVTGRFAFPDDVSGHVSRERQR